MNPKAFELYECVMCGETVTSPRGFCSDECEAEYRYENDDEEDEYNADGWDPDEGYYKDEDYNYDED